MNATLATASTRSATPPGRTAARHPSGTPSPIASPIAAAVSASVEGRTSSTMASTVRPLTTSVPRSPRSRCSRNVPRRSGKGRSSPIAWLNCATASGVARGPSSTGAGLPGIASVSANSRMAAPSRTSRVAPTRRATASPIRFW